MKRFLKVIQGLGVVSLATLCLCQGVAQAKWPFQFRKDAPKTPEEAKAPVTAFDTPHMWYYDSRMNQKRCLTLKQARRAFLDPRMAIKPCPAEKLEKDDSTPAP